MTSTANGYSKTSVILHWIAAISVIALFFTHEGERGDPVYAFHVGFGALIGWLILWRALRRPVRGFAVKPDQPAILNLVSSVVLWALLAAMVIVIVTGYFLPWSLGNPVDVFGIFSIPSPMGRSRELHEFMEEAHELSGQAFVPLVLLHVAGALKHHFIDKDGVMKRMITSETGGK